MNKIKNSKGFTLMEMLIVVAIIAILVAIAIPTFNSSLNKARVAADAANIRSGYAAVMAEVLTADTPADATYGLNDDGTVVQIATGATGNYVTVGNATAAQNIAGQDKTWTRGNHVSYSYSATDDKVEINVG